MVIFEHLICLVLQCIFGRLIVESLLVSGHCEQAELDSKQTSKVFSLIILSGLLKEQQKE